MGEGKQVSILDVVGKLQQFQKDLEYVNALKEKIAGLADRFPMIYNGVTRQIDFFQRKIDELRGLTVAVPDVQVFEAQAGDGAVAAARPKSSPQMEARQAPAGEPAVKVASAADGTETQELPSNASEGRLRAPVSHPRKKVGKRR